MKAYMITYKYTTEKEIEWERTDIVYENGISQAIKEVKAGLYGWERFKCVVYVYTEGR